ncbi:sacsin N-terminal ATP-binding-like domain-containing protein [Jatrophihabitans sp. YIM 134969]
MLVDEHGKQEDSFRTGGYAKRQVLELVQNAADALLISGTPGRVELRLTESALYCANEGRPFTRSGVDAVAHAYISGKRGKEAGRFGLGFKSVLGISSSPTIFSRSVSFGFDAARAREELADIAPDAEAFPVLRTPVVVNPDAEFATDPVLAELAVWATTVVRLPLANVPEALAKELFDFPREFLLFARNVDTLHIGVELAATAPLTVEYRCTMQDDLATVTGGGRPDADWLVLERTHRPSEDALAEVGEALRRDEVLVSSAVPVDDPGPLGRFWAYFPLQDTTSTRGIHNAPWRISDDRTTLLDGQFNTELLDVVGDLVVENMHRLVTPDDPARHFDFLPARGREAPNDSDRYLAATIPVKARRLPCIPDADGTLRRTDELYYLQSDVELELEAYGRWDATPGRPVDSPHWVCYRGRDRRARLKTLMRLEDEQTTDREVSPAEWLERIAGDGIDLKVEAALQIVFTVKNDVARRLLLLARILPDSTGRLHRLAATDELFLRGNVLSSIAGLQLLRPTLLERGDVLQRLITLGFRDVDPREELARLAVLTARQWGASSWESFWELVDEVTNRDAEEILVKHVAAGAPLRVKCADGQWHDIGTAVVPGIVEPVDESLAIDVERHEMHLGLLKALGVSARPLESTALAHDLTFLEYQRIQRDAYLRELPPRGRPPAAALEFRERAPVGPLHVLRRFVDTGDLTAAEIWTSELLSVAGFERWRLMNLRKPIGTERDVPAPHLWAAQRYGLLTSPWGPRSPAQCLHPDLSRYTPLLPVALNAAATKLTTVASIEAMPLDLWREFLTRPTAEADPWLLGELLLSAATRLPENEAPARVPAAGGDAGMVDAADLLVALTEDEVDALSARALSHVAVRSESDAELLSTAWGCRLASTVLRVEILSETPSEPVVLLDRFRGLRVLSEGRLDNYELVLCSDLARQITGPDGTQFEAADYLRSGNTVYYLNTLTDEELLERLAEDLALPLTATALQRVLEDAQDAQVKQRIAQCRLAASVAEKLLTLLPAAVLESALPAGLLESVRLLGEDTGPHQVAELLLHVHGYSVLTELRRPLEDAGFPVPDRWAGSAPAVAFVRSLGMPREFAGVRGGSLDSDVTVLGPPRLDDLHDYQMELAQQIREIVLPSAVPSRALLFLPTGAGKTRVTVEALCKAFVEDGLGSPLLWIAQSEELCEQAVQTWSVVWREFGDRPLRLCRLWSSNEVADSDDAPTVVVATDAKLDKCRDRPEYNWLRSASAVIIDEAHTATGAGIDATLRWLGLAARETERPLLGLTATPFKGTGEEANRRLAARFGHRQLDVLGEDPYGELQRRGVLARVEHRVLDGTAVELAADEVRQVNTFGALPQAVLERIGRDEQRSRRLLEDITNLPEDWPVLVFTASVLSAQVLAALLRVRGIAAASISGATRIYDRRHNIEAFRRGELRVLTNCNVLTQGFDAPAVRALYIARPTFSPNAYIQMVGRGLRGRLNGGKDECLVVNVADTFGQFGDKLAYKEFDYLWDSKGGELR